VRVPANAAGKRAIDKMADSAVAKGLRRMRFNLQGNGDEPNQAGWSGFEDWYRAVSWSTSECNQA
jgi:hypothetical protein